MRRFLLSVLALLFVSPIYGQKLVRGERAPELQVREWLCATPSLDGKAVYIEFFHSSNPTSVKRLAELDKLARSAGTKLTVVVITREQSNAVNNMLRANNPAYYAAVDDGGKTFSAYSVLYVPYSVITDRKGRIIWLGNPTSLSNDKIIEMLN